MMRWWLAAGLVLGLLMPVSALPCDLHPVPERDTGLVKVEPLETTGLFGFWYDSDMDGIADRALIFQMASDGTYIAWPLFYMEKVDLYGRAQEVWIDTGGEGNCSQIRLYWIRQM